jgi:hypothetical protein
MITSLFADLALLALLPIFWVPLAIITIILWCFVVHERGGWATIATIALGVAIAAKFPVVIDFITNPLYVAGALVLYAVIGVLWARYKWSNFLTKKAEAFVASRAAFLRQKNLPLDYFKAHSADAEMLASFVKEIKYGAPRGTNWADITKMSELLKLVAPQASTNKGSIVIWIAYWPISVIWFIVADLVTELAEAIYRAVSGHFQRMSDAKFDSI